MAERSKQRICGSRLASIAGSNPAGSMDVCCECCVLSGRGLCDEPIHRPEESYRLWLGKPQLQMAWAYEGCTAIKNGCKHSPNLIWMWMPFVTCYTHTRLPRVAYARQCLYSCVSRIAEHSVLAAVPILNHDSINTRQSVIEFGSRLGEVRQVR